MAHHGLATFIGRARGGWGVIICGGASLFHLEGSSNSVVTKLAGSVRRSVGQVGGGF